ncbi:2-aminoethanethiol dioxygenase [Exaiptasia diaphana]|uniref:2-aminoethanethiol dioxygenase n=1 Tax=Exaiptasia diaphana TaxID=2652724 RepID=A0A913Y0H5_EXADI|nr:2-aminoethanethiol dioxygenase [Exaiptasia diaphana]
MATIQRLAKQAFITFRTKESPTFASNLEKLKNLLDKLTADDINLSLPNEQLDAIVPPTREAPVSHIGIYECPYFSMGVFIIKKGCEIPLHDHPSMYGLCKVLYGKIKVRCYSLSSDGNSEAVNGTVKQKRAIRCQVMNDMTYDSSTGSCVLTPMIGNYHSIHAVPGPTAFLDILAPPYAPQEERDCNYYKECDQMVRQKHNFNTVSYFILEIVFLISFLSLINTVKNYPNWDLFELINQKSVKPDRIDKPIKL